MDPAISIRGITKNFAKTAAVDNVDLDIPGGTVYGLLGPNGAGKTTLVRMLSTMIKPTAGTAVVDGFDILKEPGKVRSSLGVLPEETGLYDRLTASETLKFYEEIQGVAKDELESRI